MRGLWMRLGKPNFLCSVLAFAIFSYAFWLYASSPSTAAYFSDTYTSLYSGRYVLHHGIPQTDPFTILGHGRRWIDQQWLGQLAFYGLWKLGGYLALVAVCFGCIAGTIAALCWWLTRVGLSWPIAIASGVLAGMATRTFAVLRVQDFIIPIALLAAILLTRALLRHRIERRTWLLIPILLVWANLHGTALLAVIIVELIIGGIALYSWRKTGDQRQILSAAIIMVAAWLTLLATPYGFSIVHYYESVIGNSDLRVYSGEWRPSHPGDSKNPPYTFVALIILATLLTRVAWRRRATDLAALVIAVCLTVGGYYSIRYELWMTIALFILVACALGTENRNGGRATRPRPSDWLVAVALAAAGSWIVWQRPKPSLTDVVFIFLGLLIALNAGMALRSRLSRSPQPRGNYGALGHGLFGTLTVVALLGTLAGLAYQLHNTATMPERQREAQYNVRQAQSIIAFLSPQFRLVCNVTLASGMLWHHPEIAGHVAIDTRLEIYDENALVPIFDLIADNARTPQRALTDMHGFTAFAAEDATVQRDAARHGKHFHVYSAIALVESGAFLPVSTGNNGDLVIAKRELQPIAQQRGIPLATIPSQYRPENQPH